MSKDNVEVATQAIAAFNRRDVDGFAALTTPDFEWSQARGTGSGVPVDASLGMVFDFRGGRISRIRGYLDHAEAVREAGLSE